MKNPAIWPQDCATDDPFDTATALSRAAEHGIDAPTFTVLLTRLLTGDQAAAERLGVHRPLTHDLDQPRITDNLATVAECAQLATDMAPHLGGEGVARLLGNAWLELNGHNRRDHYALMTAIAAAGFIPEEDDKHMRSPFIQWTRRKPIASVEERHRFRAVDREPHRLCRIVSRGPQWTFEDVLDGQVITADPTPLAYLLCDDGPAALTRIAHTTAGRVATVGWVLPTLPNVEELRQWRLRRVWLHRLVGRRATVEQVMKDSPWVREVIRAATEVLQSGQ